MRKNLKHREREKLVAEKQQRHRTGGGPGQPNVSFDPLIMEATASLLVEVPHVIDSDTADIVENIGMQ